MLRRASFAILMVASRLRHGPVLVAALSCLVASSAMAVTYTDNGNGTVTDPGTGLTWMRCAMGQTWTGSTCSGVANTYTWDQANALTGTVSFAGNSDWRLPNIRELHSIVDRSAYQPAINSTAFPQNSTGSFWSSTPSVNNVSNAWFVFFNNGSVSDAFNKSSFALPVRLVRGGQSVGLLSIARPTTDYIDHGNGTATHTPTGLMWQRCGKGETWTGSTCSGGGTSYTWDAAVAMTDSFAGYNDWRLPTIDEFETLFDYTTYSPALNTTIFPAVYSFAFWSASAYSGNSGYAFVADLSKGSFDDGGDKTYTFGVRLVRGAQTTTTTTPTTTTTTPTTTTTSPTTTTTSSSVTTTTQSSGNYGRLNDTGVNTFGDASVNNLTTEPALFAGQDAGYGRDAAAKAGQLAKIGAGSKGFDFTKIANNGTALPASAALGTGPTDWGCTRDNVTGLMWQANPSATSMTWDQASAYPGQANAPQLCGNYDWRLPTVTELTSIVDFGQITPITADTAYFTFPNTATLYFWTAVPYPEMTGYSWSVAFGSGSDTVYNNLTTLAVRLVRGAAAYTAASETTPTADFVDNGNGTVTHQKTGLIWMRCALGQTWSAGACTGTATAYSWQNALSAQFTFNAAHIYAGRTDWRLPNIKELQSLYEYARANPTVVPAINVTLFPNMPAHVQGSSASHFWSSTPSVKAANSAWSEGFDNGGVQPDLKTNASAVRLVSGGTVDTTATTTTTIAVTTTTTSTALTTTTTTVPATTTTTTGATTTSTLQPGAFGGNVISAGNEHTCALTPAGGVKCWGYNSNGQLGDNTMINRSAPVDVSGLTVGAVGIVAGYWHNCVLTNAGGIKCWGENMFGKLGDGTNTRRYTPVDVVGLTSGVQAIAAGAYHTCALTSAGAVKCWGYNYYGQLGDNTTTDHALPADVSGLTSGVVAIAAGENHTCAVTAAGGVKCWGYNASSQLGDGTTTNRSAPVDVSGLSGAVAISAGQYHTCVRTTTGGVKCWGGNGAGQLGDGTTTTRATPVAVTGLASGVAVLSLGNSHTCVLTTSGGMKCWGINNDGELGDNTTLPRAAPVDVLGLSSGVSAIATGYFHTCAVTTTGGVKCWGSNYYGEVGDGTTNSRAAPVDVLGLTGVVSTSSTTTTTTTTVIGSTTTTTGSGTTTTTGATTTTTLGGSSGSVTLNFAAGWNLVGNGLSGMIDVTSMFTDSNTVTSVWKWIVTRSKWVFYTPTQPDGGAAYAASKGYESLRWVSGGEGFWLNAKSAFSVQLPSGPPVASAFFQDLLSGWNLIAVGDNSTPSAFNKALNLTPPAAGDIPLNVTSLWAWDATLNNWYFYAPSLEKTNGLAAYVLSKNYLDFETKKLDPAMGFWVNKP